MCPGIFLSVEIDFIQNLFFQIEGHVTWNYQKSVHGERNIVISIGIVYLFRHLRIILLLVGHKEAKFIPKWDKVGLLTNN